MKLKEENKTSLNAEPIVGDLFNYVKTMRKEHGDEISRKQTTAHERSKENIDSEKKVAAKTIQRFWRNYKVKEKILKNPYLTYLSMYDPNDEKLLLSSLMFGRHIAEIKGEERIPNPYIPANAHYHRSDPLEGQLLDALLDEFNIPLSNKNNHIYVPISNLHLTSIQKVFDEFLPESKDELKIIKDQEHSLVLVEIPCDKLGHLEWYRQPKWILKALGLVATPWEISSNLTHITAQTPQESVVLSSQLPTTKKELLQSDLFKKTKKIASQETYPTHHLAKSIIQLLTHMDELPPEAIQRIALILDLSNTFYSYQYARYAFCVYALIHEISLSFSQKNLNQTKVLFDQFMKESEHTLQGALAISNTETQDQYHYFSSPALSGTHAHTIVLSLFNALEKKSGKPLSIQSSGPTYFEFDLIRGKNDDPEPDVYAITTGPVVTPDGLIPGTDINQFIQQNIIDKNRQKPTVLLIDTTTSLYKNLHLNEDSKQLIQSGQLSIILVESHQKFGLLHTDQAQYGRVMALCADNFFDPELLNTFQQNAYLDFNEKMDLKIGAFISVSCSETLETIKQQHFNNGMLFRNILTQCLLASSQVISHETMLNNLDELYFITLPKTENGRYLYTQRIEGQVDCYLWDGTDLSYISKNGVQEKINIKNKSMFVKQLGDLTLDAEGKIMLSNFMINDLIIWNSDHLIPYNALEEAVQGLIEQRDSFGHFSTTIVSFGQVRLSPNASDPVDSLIQASQIYLLHHYKSHLTDLSNIFSSLELDTISLISEQIVIIAIMSTLCTRPINDLNLSEVEDLFVKFHVALEKCHELDNRSVVTQVKAYYQELKQVILKDCAVENRKSYIENLLSTTSISQTQTVRSKLDKMKGFLEDQTPSGKEQFTSEDNSYLEKRSYGSKSS